MAVPWKSLLARSAPLPTTAQLAWRRPGRWRSSGSSQSGAVARGDSCPPYSGLPASLAQLASPEWAAGQRRPPLVSLRTASRRPMLPATASGGISHFSRYRKHADSCFSTPRRLRAVPSSLNAPTLDDTRWNALAISRGASAEPTAVDGCAIAAEAAPTTPHGACGRCSGRGRAAWALAAPGFCPRRDRTGRPPGGTAAAAPAAALAGLLSSLSTALPRF
mmetsp:Transcript_3491/g.8856  ORF Transcript_3491/g.8856 Transcript_3491/m.8856 type:complete len:220 (-) Transcript_3491:1113-1772(-)